MNIISLANRNISARFFAGVTILSLVMSAVPVAFFTASAATNLVGPASKTIDSTDPYESGVVDATGFSSLTFSFDYDSTELDGSDDSFTYGWRDAGGDNDLGTVVGLVGATSAEIDSISVPLPVEALVADLEVYVYSTAVPGNESDEVKLSNILVAGDLKPVPATAELKIIKEVAGGTAVPADWEMTAVADGNEYDFTDNGDSELFHTVVADLTYLMSESVVEDYELTSIECDGGTQAGAEITLTEGESVTCVFLNTYNVKDDSDSDDSDDNDENTGGSGSGGKNNDYDWASCVDGPDWIDNPYWAVAGKKKDGSDITDPNRNNLDVVVGEPDWVSGGSTGFFSLGFGGYAIVDFYNYVLDVDGVDLTIHEATNGRYPLEQAEVYVSQGCDSGDSREGCDSEGNTMWSYAGIADNTAPDRVTGIDFSATGLPWIQYVKLVDITNPALHQANADGFDLDAIGATMAVCSQPGKECDDDDSDENSNDDTYIIGGYKYEVDGEVKTPKAGWNIYAYNTDDATSLATTTDSKGYYYFDVEDGDWEITEEVLTDWNQVSVWQNGEVVETEGENVGYCEFDSFDDESFYHCDFYNEFIGSSDDSDDNDDGEESNDDNDNNDNENSQSTAVNQDRERNPSTGTRLRRPKPAPFVLGASTSQCGMLLHDYMKIGIANNPYEVKMLQYFLTGQGFYVPATGFFGPKTDKAVRDFQMAHQAEILTPWMEAGITNHNNPTGYAYMLTRWKANNLICPGSEPLPTLVP